MSSVDLLPSRSTLGAVLLLLHSGLASGCSWARELPPATVPPAAVAPAARAVTPPPAASLPTLTVKEPLGVPRRHWPITAGMPFPPDMLADVSRLRISAADTAFPVQGRVLSRWPNGHVRWAQLDWQVDLKPHEKRVFRVDLETLPAAPGVTISDLADRVEVNTGALQFAVPKHTFAVVANVRLDGMAVSPDPISSFLDIGGRRIAALPPSTVTISEPGPLRARIELQGHYATGFDYVIRIDAFAQQPFVRVLHTLEQHNAEPYTLVRQIALGIPTNLVGAVSYEAGLESGAPLRGRVPARGTMIGQEDNDTLVVDGVRRSAHASGWVDVRDSVRGLAIAARYFWQEYPQSFFLQPGAVTYNLWAPQPPAAKFGMGAAKTHEMVFYFHGRTPPGAALLSALVQPLPAAPDPRWVATSGALRNAVAPDATATAFLHELAAADERDRRQASTERWDDSGAVRCPPPHPGAASTERPRQGFFGMFNWGDWNYPGYHDTTKGCDAWGNLEYDMTQVFALAYAATGAPHYYDSMVAAARHFMDVDRIHYDATRPNWVGMNHPKNPLHFSFELGGVDLGHTWTEGLLSYYLLTGDRRGLAAARGIADFLVRRVHGSTIRGNPRQWGWPQIALVAAYETSGDAAYRTAALEYARGGMAHHPPDQVGHWKMGILAEGLAYTHSVTQDTAIRGWLIRYAAAVRQREGPVDPRFMPAVMYVARLTGQHADLDTTTATVARLKFGNWGKPFTIAGRVGFALLSNRSQKITTDSTD